MPQDGNDFGNLKIREIYNIDQCIRWIQKNDFKRIGLQFPSYLLDISIPVHDALKECTEASIVILGDTSYSSCCIDELAGARWDVDAIVHYGNACLSSRIGRVPAFYVFGSAPCSAAASVDAIISRLTDILPSDGGTGTGVLFAYDFRFQSLAKIIAQSLQKSLVMPVWFSEPDFSTESRQEDVSESTITFSHAGRIFRSLNTSLTRSPSAWCLVYLGDCDMAFYRILVTLNEAYSVSAFTVNPQTAQVDPCEKSAAKLLNRRFYLMEKTKRAKRIGILIGTLSVGKYKDIINRMKRLLRLARKPFITLAIGSLNEAKLMNVPNLDAFVLVACPESSLFDDHSISTPIVTPYELECVLFPSLDGDVDSTEQPYRCWRGDRMWLNFSDILKGGPAYVEEALFSDETEEKASEESSNSVDEKSALVLRDHANWSLALACEDLAEGSVWRGLDPRFGQTPIALIQSGRSGLPVNYSSSDQ